MQSPAGAEAQCVALEELGFVEGIMTQDSRAFVFGGQCVLTDIFDDHKYVKTYLMERAMAKG